MRNVMTFTLQATIGILGGAVLLVCSSCVAAEDEKVGPPAPPEERPNRSIARAIYFADESAGTIYRANPDGSDTRPLIAGLRMPRGPAIDARDRKIYWVDALAYKIQRANLDGSGVEDFITDGLATIGPALVDSSRRRLYWVNSVHRSETDVDRSIHSVKLDGTDRKIVVPPSLRGTRLITTPVQNEANGRLFWMARREPRQTRIVSVDVDGADFTDHGPAPGAWDQYHFHGLAIDPRRNKLYWPLYAARKIQRSDLDGTNVEDVLSGLGGEPQAIALDLDGGKIYWGEVHGKMIGRANLDGSDRQTLKSHLRLPRGLAIEFAKPAGKPPAVPNPRDTELDFLSRARTPNVGQL